MQRDLFKSRIGFMLVSAGCAIGLGNVWKFPYICAANGGAAFIIIYLIFLAILGYPLLMAEFAIGRGSGMSIIKAYDVLESKSGKFSKNKYFGLAANYLLMSFYSMVCGWMLDYTVKSAAGSLSGITSQEVSEVFSTMLGSAPEMTAYSAAAILIGFGICAIGLNKGVEKITNIIMMLLFIIMLVLAANSCTLDRAADGLSYYLVPDAGTFIKDNLGDTLNGIGNILFTAMSHAFFTLSIGVGSMMIFGSYLKKERKITGEALSIVLLDTAIALIAGFIIIPACVNYDVPLNSGPRLLFISLPNVFNEMPGGRVWMSLFFVFMTFAALSTMIAVFENIIAMWMDSSGMSRRKVVAINIPLMIVLSLPAILGFNALQGFNPLGEGTTILDLEDFIVSNNILPMGALTMAMFCTRQYGWGWDGFLAEVNTGTGWSLSPKWKGYMTWGIPAVIIFVFLKGYYDYFAESCLAVRIVSMAIAVVILAYVLDEKRRSQPQNPNK